MGKSKTDFFNEKQNRLAGFSKALAHPARIAIAMYLVENGKCNCGDIVKAMPLAQPTISQHIKELKSAGLVEVNGKGKGNSYQVNPKAFAKFEKQMKNLFKSVKRSK